MRSSIDYFFPPLIDTSFDFRFELVEPVGLDENQLKDIPYENVK